MTCETCEELQTADGDPDLHQFSCKISSRQIFNPYIRQKWCPKTKNRRSPKTRKQDDTIQTDYKEMEFIDTLSQKQLCGYIDGVVLRDQSKTDFNIGQITAYAKSKLK